MARTAIQRGTIYLGIGFAYRRVEARDIRYQIGRAGQFSQAIELIFICKGCRKPSTKVVVTGKLVVLAGWGHPNSPGDWGDSMPLSPMRWSGFKATIQYPRFPFGDERWVTEFDAFLKDYLDRSGAQVLLDYREHDFKNEYQPHYTKKELTPEMPVLVTGVIAGRIVPVDQWPNKREIPAQEFLTLADAQKVFPDLALKHSSKRFWGPIVDECQHGICTRFDSLDVFERLSR